MNTGTWTTIALLLSGGAATAQGSWQVSITDLPLLPGGTYASAYAINDSGKILGMANDSTGAFKTVQWVNGQISVIPELSANGALCVPEDLNDAGESVGRQVISGFFSYAIHWDALNNPSALPGLPSGSPSYNIGHAINASGQSVGRAKEGGPNFWGHAVVWSQGALQSDLGFMGGGNYSEALGINDSGAVVGVAALANTNQHAFLWQNGQFTDLSNWTGGGASSKAFAINNLGEIVGLNAGVASLWRNGSVSALPMPPGMSAFTPAIDINDAGDIIATGPVLFPDEVGVLWRGGTPISLGTLPGGTISRVRRINAAGEIVGEAKAANGFFHAVKWTVTAPAGVYCTAKTNSLGCVPSIGSTGVPSASNATPFVVRATNVLNRRDGVFFYGHSAASVPFQGGFFCVTAPIRRTPLLNSGGSALPTLDCSGVYTFDFNAWIQTGNDPLLSVGQEVDGQFWSRDPQSPSTTGLTNAVRFFIGL